MCTQLTNNNQNVSIRNSKQRKLFLDEESDTIYVYSIGFSGLVQGKNCTRRRKKRNVQRILLHHVALRSARTRRTCSCKYTVALMPMPSAFFYHPIKCSCKIHAFRQTFYSIRACCYMYGHGCALQAKKKLFVRINGTQ